MHPEFKKAFTGFDENKFLSNELVSGLLDEFDKNITTEYRCTQNERLKNTIRNLQETAKTAILKGLPNPLIYPEIKLINESSEIICNYDEIPYGYEPIMITAKKLKANYLYRLIDTGEKQYKVVNTSDLVYLLDYLTNIL